LRRLACAGQRQTQSQCLLEKAMRVLVVDDDVDIRRALRQSLRAEGFVVDEAADGQEARFKGSDPAYDLIILDLKLPKLDGLSVLRELRAAQVTTPVLFLSASGTREVRIRALEFGADDYLVKPVWFDELLAYVRALLRRPKRQLEAPLRVGWLTLDQRARQVHWQQVKVELTALEFSILEQLMLHPGDVISRTQIYERVWDEHIEVISNVIDVHIKEIRRKLAQAGAPQVIETVRGSGYRLLKGQDIDDEGHLQKTERSP
jgi:two-component system OmpR family response regulator